jgi:hypothetical protein
MIPCNNCLIAILSVLNFEFWSLVFVWDLGFGVWNLYHSDYENNNSGKSGWLSAYRTRFPVLPVLQIAKCRHTSQTPGG